VSGFAGWFAGQSIFTGSLTHPMNKNGISSINDSPNVL
jgi:hypothetical protein